MIRSDFFMSPYCFLLMVMVPLAGEVIVLLITGLIVP